MKVQVTRFILSESDICDFFNTTKNFGKRFYKVRRYSTVDGVGVEYKDIEIHAIAVSRDLIYKIEWHIGCEEREDSPFPKKYHPKKDWHLNWFYPQYSPVVDKPCITDAFDYRGFVESDSIEIV